jgi:hypothetical protein
VDILKRGVEIVEHTKVDDLIIKDNIALGAKTKNKDYYANNTSLIGHIQGQYPYPQTRWRINHRTPLERQC